MPRKISPWVSDYPAQGRHQSEMRYPSSFRDTFCPPGTISRRTTGKERMRITSGRGWSEKLNSHSSNEAPSRELIRKYNEYLAKGKVSAKGAGHDPRRWGYTWPENMMRKAENAEKNGLSMESFVDLLKQPLHKRPKTIRECIQFFYPMSGPIPPDKELSPFISTSIAAYAPIDADPSKPNNIPLQLGDVSMMYGWYLVYRLLLCPDEYESEITDILQETTANNKLYPFSLVQENVLMNSRLRDRVQGTIEADIDLLSSVGSAVRVVSEVASALASGGAGVPTSLSDIVELAESQAGAPMRELLRDYGAAAVTSILVQQLDIPYTYANDLANTVLEGAMDPRKWAQILEDRNSRDAAIRAASEAVYTTAQKYVLNTLEDKALDLGINVSRPQILEMTTLLESLTMTGKPSEALTNLYRQAKSKAQSALSNQEKILIKAFEDKQEYLRKKAQLKLQDFSTFGAPARKNPAVIAVLAVTAVAQAVQGGIEYEKANKFRTLAATQNYFTENFYRLGREFSSNDIAFDLSSHVRHGVWEKGNIVKDGKFILAPDCRLQQGGQVFDYWVHVWSQVKDLLRQIRSRKAAHFEQFASAKRMDISSIPEFVLPRHLFRNQEPVKFESTIEGLAEEEGHTFCQGLGILAKHAGPSMGLVLEKLDAFSPFTHAYGFAPTFYIEPSTNTLKIDGTAARRFLGTQNVWRNQDGRLQAAHAPGRIDLNLERAYSQRGVECWAGETPFSSRRLLAGSYGQRCNITFDVGIDDVSPVMGAQFAGLMAALFCHPEALKNCKLMGFDWAQDILPPDEIAHISDSTKLATGALTPSALDKARAKLSVVAPNVRQEPLAETIREATQSGALSTKQMALDVLKSQNFQVSPSTKLRLQRAVEQRKAAGQSLDLSKMPVSVSKTITSVATVTGTIAALGFLAFKISKSGK